MPHLRSGSGPAVEIVDNRDNVVARFFSRGRDEDDTSFFDVEDFGAKGDGVADDTVKIQAAINALTAPGIVRLPPGTFKITAPLVLKTGVILQGAGKDVTTIANASAGGDTLQFVYGAGPTEVRSEVRGMTLTKSGAGTPNAGLNFTRCAVTHIEDVRVTQHVYGSYHFWGEQHTFRNVDFVQNTVGTFLDGSSAAAASNFNEFDKCFYQSNVIDVQHNQNCGRNKWIDTPFYGASTASIYCPAGSAGIVGSVFEDCWWESVTGLICDLRSGQGFRFVRPQNSVAGIDFITVANFNHPQLRIEDPFDSSGQARFAVAIDYDLVTVDPVNSGNALSQVIGSGTSVSRDSSHSKNHVARGLGGTSFVTSELGVGASDKNLNADINLANNAIWTAITGGTITSAVADPIGGTGAYTYAAAKDCRQTIANANGGSALSGATFTTQVWAKSNGGRLKIYMQDSNSTGVYTKTIALPTNQWVLCSFTMPFAAGTGTSLLVDFEALGQSVTLYWPVVTKGDVIVPALPASRDMSGWAGPYEVFGPNHNIRVFVNNAAPAAGTWAVGDEAINYAPVAAGTDRWRCTTAGTPGTWKAVAVAA